MIEYVGWTATAVFVGSYFFKRPETLRHVQMAGAAMWIAYGALIGAAPVVAANVLVLGAAAWTLARSFPSERPHRDGSGRLRQGIAAPER